MTQTVPQEAPGDAPPRIPDDSTFGARLALIRQLMQWGNVAEAARECGLPVDSWRHWERDGMEPRRLVTIALAIATRANVDLDWLVYGPSRGKVRAKATPEYPHRRDPLAPRVISRTGQVRHGDGRKDRHLRPVALSA